MSKSLPDLCPQLPEDPSAEGVDMAWLLGQPHLSDYISFYQAKAIGGDVADGRALTAEWSAANDYYADLEKAESGIADTIECRALPARFAKKAAKIEENQWFRHAFDNLPYSIELVELDKLVVSQIHIENGLSGPVARRLGPSPSLATLFDFCLPLEPVMPPVEIVRLASNRYVLSSPSSDFRCHEPKMYKDPPFALEGTPGPVMAMLGVTVGFGSNFLSGVRSGARVLLQNGYHRCYALRSAGFTHAWCIIEHVTRKEELRLTANEDVISDPEFYFASKRPPILRDFFDPRIVKHFQVKQMECIVEIEIGIRATTGTKV